MQDVLQHRESDDKNDGRCNARADEISATISVAGTVIELKEQPSTGTTTEEQ